jgi:ATP/maltotriose-dependent transcriptional regulator MalT
VSKEVDFFARVLNSSKTIVCIKDRHHKVLSQNTPCKSLCGDQTSKQCLKNCMKYYQRQTSQRHEEGTQYYPGKDLSGKIYDVLFIHEGEYLISLLYALENRLEKDKEFFQNAGLTTRELEIADLIGKGKTNSEIQKLLFIAKPTLKTHLNHIYQKLPSDFCFPLRKKQK